MLNREPLWVGDNPFYLAIYPIDGEPAFIDLDEPGWLRLFAEYLRLPGTWGLIDKVTDHIVLTLVVRDGEQPYYVARHIGNTSAAGQSEILAYGLGKKRVDGHVDRLWIFLNGMVCGGDDAEDIGLGLLKAYGREEVDEEAPAAPLSQPPISDEEHFSG